MSYCSMRHRENKGREKLIKRRAYIGSAGGGEGGEGGGVGGRVMQAG